MSNPQRVLPFYLDVTKEPFSADPTGCSDSTQSIRQAIDYVVGLTREAFLETLEQVEALPGENALLGQSCENRKENGKVIAIFPQVLPYAPVIYFPAGTYLISDTLSYSFNDMRNSFGNELCWQIRMKGAGAGRSIIRLEDGASGFADGEPKPVISFMRGKTSNVAMSNYIEDLSIETGRRNPGAVGLDFFANNSGSVRRVRIRSGDGSGFAGLCLGHRNYSGVLIKSVDIDGFDYGMHLNSDSQSMFAAAEHVTIQGSRKAGIFVGDISASLRKITAKDCPIGVICGGHSGHVILIDSFLEGPGTTAIDHRTGVLYASNVGTSGYDRACNSQTSLPQEKSDYVNELVAPCKLSSSQEAGMARLDVEDTPFAADASLSVRAVGVKEFGARGDGIADDSQWIQAAINSGATEVYFEPGRYRLCSPIQIPAGIRHICFGFCDLVAGEPLATKTDQGAFVIGEDSSEPLLIDDLFAWESWRGAHVMFDHACRRTLILSDLHTQTLSLYRNSVEGGKVFLENVCCTAGVVPGTKGHGRACMRFKGQQVWARQLNPERGEPMVLNDGGKLWVLGFKTEDEGIAFHTINGGKSEILGGILNSGRPAATAFVAEDSQIRVSAASNGWIEHAYYGTAIQVKRGGEIVESISADECVSRNFATKRGKQFSIPLYAS